MLSFFYVNTSDTQMGVILMTSHQDAYGDEEVNEAN